LFEIDSNVNSGKLFPTKIGIGIHTGEAVCGNIGTAERHQYSITGSVVILASRIEQMNKELNSQFLVSGDVINSVGPFVYSRCMGDVNLKGWSQPVTIYKLA